MDNLNTYLADLNVLSVKVKNYHWFVTGKNFFTLHGYFEEMYKKINEYIDEVAERILSINKIPFATMAEYLEKSYIKEANQNNPNEMIETLIADFNYLKINLKISINDSDDVVTQDMLTGMLAYFEKQLWMLNAYLT